MTVVVVVACVILAGLSVIRRARARAVLVRAGYHDETKSSPLSEGLKDLIAVAGGIYLSMLMLTSFLQIRVPEVIGWGAFQFEPMAALAFILAVVQPFFGDVFRPSRLR